MTITITPERVQWFANYYKANPSWGVFHICLEDGNWRLGAREDGREAWPVDIREAAAWFDRLSPSQRRRLKLKAEDRASTRLG